MLFVRYRDRINIARSDRYIDPANSVIIVGYLEGNSIYAAALSALLSPLFFFLFFLFFFFFQIPLHPNRAQRSRIDVSISGVQDGVIDARQSGMGSPGRK